MTVAELITALQFFPADVNVRVGEAGDVDEDGYETVGATHVISSDGKTKSETVFVLY